MKNTSAFFASFYFVVMVHSVAGAQTIWNTGSLNFVKTVAGQKDCITPQTCLTRITVLFNDVCENVSGRQDCGYTGPCNTEWATGNIANWNTLAYQRLYLVNDCMPPTMVGIPLVLHLLAENIYLQVTFTSWQSGGAGGFSYTRTTSAALPVTLSRFTGFKTNHSNVLEWTSSTELNSSFYNVQRSNNALDFTTIGRVNTLAVNGNSSSPLHYRFEDTDLQPGYNYYRLQQTDIDGKQEYSAIVKLFVNKNGNRVILSQALSPAKVSLNIYSEKAANAFVTLSDLNGRKLKEIKTSLATGTNLVTISLDGLAAGTYIIQLYEDAALSFSGKITKW